MTFVPDKKDSTIMIKDENIGLFTRVTCKFIGSVFGLNNTFPNLKMIFRL